MNKPTLKRGFLGYSRKGVTQLLTDREDAFVRATEEARVAGARVKELEEELGRLRREAAERARQLEATEVARGDRPSLERRIAELEATNRELESELEGTAERIRAFEQRQAAEAEAPSTPTTTEGIGEVLEATERALAQLFQDAGTIAEKKLRDIERARDDLREDIEQLGAWRRRLIPLTEAVRQSIDDARAQAAVVGDRLREVVVPATSAMEALAGRLSELAETSEPPELVGRRAGPVSVIHLEEADSEAGGEAPGTPEEAAAVMRAPDRPQRPNAE